MPASSAFKRPRFTKAPGPKRSTPVPVRLTEDEHEKFRRLVRGGNHSAPGRLRAWAEALETTLLAPYETINTANTYTWLCYRLRDCIDGGRPMLYSDAAKIWVAGARSRNPCLDGPERWLELTALNVPSIASYHFGYGVPNRAEGTYGCPFIPVMLPPGYFATLACELADIAVERDQRGTRGRVGRKIEAFLQGNLAKSSGSCQPWNESAVYAVEQIVSLVMYRAYYIGRFGEASAALDNAVNEIGDRVGRELRSMLVDRSSRPFENLMKRLRDDVERFRPKPKAQV